MLTIKGILKLQNVMCQSRQVWLVTQNENETGQPYYSFRFKAMGDGKGYNKETEIRLIREMHEGRGAYEMFVMGLGVTTRIWVTPDDLKSMDALAYLISKALTASKHWWDTEATENMKSY